jgi:hypothetical protein
MMRRTSGLSLDQRHWVVEFEIDETLDRVCIGDDDSYGSTDTEPLLATLGKPGLPVRLHHVLVVIERVEAQQSIDAKASKLHEATIVHNRCDESIEGLTQALAQVAALQERIDVAIRLIGTFFESREILTETTELIGSVSSSRRIVRLHHRLECSVHDEIGITPDR